MAKSEMLSTEEGTAAVQQTTAEKEAAPSGGEILYGKQPTQAAADDMQNAAAQTEESFDDLIAGRFKKDFEDE